MALQNRLAGIETKSAVQLLADPLDALAARLELIDAAEVSLDLQYYIWQNDTAGAIMLGALRKAAKRGVHIRLLIDDNGTAGWTARWPRSTSYPMSTCASSAPSRSGPHASSATCPISAALTAGCTTRR